MRSEANAAVARDKAAEREIAFRVPDSELEPGSNSSLIPARGIDKGSNRHILACDSPSLGTLRVKYSPSSVFFFGWGEELVLVGSAVKKESGDKRMSLG